MNGLNFDLAALSFAAFIGSTTYLVIKFWHWAHPERKPVDWEVDYPEFAHAKETHVRFVPYAYDEIIWHEGPRGPATIRRWRKDA